MSVMRPAEEMGLSLTVLDNASEPDKGNAEHVDRNLCALAWIHERREDIRRVLKGSSAHAPPCTSLERRLP